LVAWKTGCSPANARTIATVAGRLAEFPRCAAALREGRLSLDRVGVLAARADAGSDEHYVQLAQVATVSQLRTAVNLEPRPDPDPRPEQASITKSSDERFAWWRIKLPHPDAAKFDAALASHREALIADWNETSALAAPRPHRRCPTRWRRSCAWSRPAGTPRPPAARTGSTPPWWCTSMWSGAPPRCIWVRCSPMPNANT
jgi:hypothetical protein